MKPWYESNKSYGQLKFGQKWYGNNRVHYKHSVPEKQYLIITPRASLICQGLLVVWMYMRLSNKLLQQAHVVKRFMSSFSKMYGRYGDHINHYEVFFLPNVKQHFGAWPLQSHPPSIKHNTNSWHLFTEFQEVSKNKTNHPISRNSYPSATSKKHCLKWGGGGQSQREPLKILTKYVAVHPTTISENHSSSGMLRILIKAQTISILRNIFAGKFTHIICVKHIFND